MKMKLSILFVILTLSTRFIFSQIAKTEINYITFELKHSKKIPNYNVKILIENRPSETLVHVTSSPMNNLFEHTKVDTTFKIDSKVFHDIINEASELLKIDLNMAILNGLDGTECSIEYGTFGNSIAFKFWSPNFETEKRGLIKYLELCKRIILIGQLKPNEIL